jgi:hypothetical protein
MANSVAAAAATDAIDASRSAGAGSAAIRQAKSNIPDTGISLDGKQKVTGKENVVTTVAGSAGGGVAGSGGETDVVGVEDVSKSAVLDGGVAMRWDGGVVDGWLTVAIVRHPYERVCAGFLEMQRNGEWGRMYGKMPYETVDAFVAQMAKRPTEIYRDRYVHVRPAVWFTHAPDGKLMVDLVLHSERLDADLGPLAARLGLRSRPGHLNQRCQARGHDALSLLSETSRRTIDKLYAADLQTFGYAPR